MNRPEVRTESLGGSPLSVAARAGRVPDWYPALPRDARGWRSHARDVAGDVGSDWFDALSPAFAASGAAAQRLAQSANGKGVVVTTGQQPGLFGGPIMTLAKAITARAIADVLRDATGIPVAPVFWAAFVRHGTRLRLRLSGLSFSASRRQSAAASRTRPC